MPTITVVVGVLLIGTGVGGFAATGFETRAITALIPAAFGLLIAVSGVIAYRDHLRKHALHAASTLALLGFLLPAGRLGMVATKEDFEWALGSYMLLLASVICLGYFLLCLQSFLKARRERLAAEAAS